MKLFITRLSVFFTGFVFLAGCAEETLPGTLEINLRHKVGDKDLILHEWIYDSPAGHPYKVRRLQQLLSDFELIRTDGTVVPFDMYHFYEFGRNDLRSFQLKQIPPGEYDRMGFVFGLDEEKNKDNAFPDDYDMIGFKWPSLLGVGYHYMRFEVTADSLGSGVIKDFNLHTGATDGNQNFLRFAFQVDPFVIDGNEYKLDLVMDLEEWLQHPEIYDFEEFGFGIMGNQQAQEILKANGVDVFSLEGPSEVINYER
jgi:hypothetical protein